MSFKLAEVIHLVFIRRVLYHYNIGEPDAQSRLIGLRNTRVARRATIECRQMQGF